jgi:hypothetical protein
LSKSRVVLNAARDNKVLDENKLKSAFQDKEKFNKFVSFVSILDKQQEDAIKSR